MRRTRSRAARPVTLPMGGEDGVFAPTVRAPQQGRQDCPGRRSRPIFTGTGQGRCETINSAMSAAARTSPPHRTNVKLEDAKVRSG
jgi:hypothetical protein